MIAEKFLSEVDDTIDRVSENCLKRLVGFFFFYSFFKKMRLPVSATGGARLPLPPRKLRACVEGRPTDLFWSHMHHFFTDKVMRRVQRSLLDCHHVMYTISREQMSSK